MPAEAAGFGGAPVLTGEWVAIRSGPMAPGDYFSQHLDLQDEFRDRFGALTWKQSCGDPHAATHDPDTAPPLPPRRFYRMDCEGNSNRIAGSTESWSGHCAGPTFAGHRPARLDEL